MAEDINRSTSIALPTEVSSEIMQKTQQESAIMRLARQITLPGNGVTIPVITGDPTAGWVDETDPKPVSKAQLGTKVMSAYKLAVIEPFSNEFKRDAAALYDALVARLPAVLGLTFDKTVLGVASQLLTCAALFEGFRPKRAKNSFSRYPCIYDLLNV